ncbi:hypothetical protein ACFONC_04245 [Luteimonas soli]|uniref:Uncharacterized protein n=1 Tax=Luteimonas soli TaxID=1648966 RepID=A0ABV7XJ80_9GAMM
MAYLLLIATLLLFGWRAWVVLANEAPWTRAIGSVLSAAMPFPVFLIVIVRHYFCRQTASERAGIPTMVQ